MKRKLFFASGAALFAMLAVTGCVPEAPTPTSTSTPTETPTTEPTATPTAEPTSDPVTLEGLVASPTGLGDLSIGGRAEDQAADTGIIVWNAEYCVRPDGETTEAEPGRWVPNFENAESFYGDSATPFFIETVSGVITRIDITTTVVEDSRGIHVGSTRDQFLTAYPGTTIAFDGPISDVYAVAGSDGTVVYEITRHDDGVPYWPADQQDKVFQIRLLAPGVNPDFATAATGNIAGVCSGI